MLIFCATGSVRYFLAGNPIYRASGGAGFSFESEHANGTSVCDNRLSLLKDKQIADEFYAIPQVASVSLAQYNKRANMVCPVCELTLKRPKATSLHNVKFRNLIRV